MKPGADGLTLYCGRALGRARGANAGGTCGPLSGPQCEDCWRSQVMRRERRASAAWCAQSVSDIDDALALASAAYKEKLEAMVHPPRPHLAPLPPPPSMAPPASVQVVHPPATAGERTEDHDRLISGGRGYAGECYTAVPQSLPHVLHEHLELCLSDGGAGIRSQTSQHPHPAASSWPRVLGCGAYAVVCLVRERASGQLRALKVADKEPLSSRGLLEQVKNEMALQQSLRHPHITRALDSLEADGKLYLLLEFAGHGTLKQLTTSHPEGKLHVREAALFLRQIAEALTYLHSDAVRVLHRDVKASSIVLSSPFEVKLSDFGWSVRFTDFELPVGPAGTSSHMAPEVAMGFPHGCGADCWSFGVTVFETTAGGLPFLDGRSACRARYEVPPSLVGDSADLIDKLLRLDPHRRARAEDLLWHPFFSTHAGVAAAYSPAVATASPAPTYRVVQAAKGIPSGRTVSPARVAPQRPASGLRERQRLPVPTSRGAPSPPRQSASPARPLLKAAAPTEWPAGPLLSWGATVQAPPQDAPTVTLPLGPLLPSGSFGPVLTPPTASALAARRSPGRQLTSRPSPQRIRSAIPVGQGPANPGRHPSPSRMFSPGGFHATCPPGSAVATSTGRGTCVGFSSGSSSGSPVVPGPFSIARTAGA